MGNVTSLFYCEKSASECYRIMWDECGEHAPSKNTCEGRFKRFRKRLWKKRVLYIWWSLEGVVYYELLKSSEIVNSAHYEQQIVNLSHTQIVKRPQWVIRPIFPPKNPDSNFSLQQACHKFVMTRVQVHHKFVMTGVQACSKRAAS
ncbi:hypothetical protein AVEN_115224-1 [Araneus ventricosus]|uniref:Mos1 transposase HTH domain-containing protein n=1 Tax=Araneus ventricosus TaxID=182803 RepID=A0A4Y1ZXX9_ARAVE|nr:hypothetical protein AVEN_115224-1 [Araneus ventricosus]